MDANKPTTEPNPHGVAAEPDRVESKVVYSLYGMLAIAAIVSAIVVFVLFRALEKQAETVDRAEIAEAGLERPPDTLPPAPRLQIHAVANWDTYRNAEVNRLTTYGWLNRESGAVHVPVDRAIELILERGVGPLPPAPVSVPQPQPTPVATGGRQ